MNLVQDSPKKVDVMPRTVPPIEHECADKPPDKSLQKR
jgi:hypothetical protein